MALLNRSSDTRSIRAVARQREKFTHDVKAGDHTFTVDEPVAAGGQDEGPSPQELLAAALASCTAVTIAATPGRHVATRYGRGRVSGDAGGRRQGRASSS